MVAVMGRNVSFLWESKPWDPTHAPVDGPTAICVQGTLILLIWLKKIDEIGGRIGKNRGELEEEETVG